MARASTKRSTKQSTKEQVCNNRVSIASQTSAACSERRSFLRSSSLVFSRDCKSAISLSCNRKTATEMNFRTSNEAAASAIAMQSQGKYLHVLFLREFLKHFLQRGQSRLLMSNRRSCNAKHANTQSQPWRLQPALKEGRSRNHDLPHKQLNKLSKN